MITLPTNTGEEYAIRQDDIDAWAELYPAVDIMQELRNMKGWCRENPRKRKTAGGITRFVNSWLTRAQNEAGRRRSAYTGAVRGPVGEVDDW